MTKTCFSTWIFVFKLIKLLKGAKVGWLVYIRVRVMPWIAGHIEG